MGFPLKNRKFAQEHPKKEPKIKSCFFHKLSTHLPTSAYWSNLSSKYQDVFTLAKKQLEVLQFWWFCQSKATLNGRSAKMSKLEISTTFVKYHFQQWRRYHIFVMSKFVPHWFNLTDFSHSLVYMAPAKKILQFDENLFNPLLKFWCSPSLVTKFLVNHSGFL